MPTYRSIKGSALTAAEFDGNTTEFDSRITDLEDNPPVAINIVSFSMSGTELTQHMSDGGTIGPIDIPVPVKRWMGEWAPTTLYSTLDELTVAGVGTFLVLADHLSAATFDAAALAADVTAGDFFVNRAYVIQTIGTTDFTLIGADSNTVGGEFTATDVGAGTGTAAQRLYYQEAGAPVNAALLDVPDQVLSGGANVTTYDLGTMSTGTLTVDCGLCPLQKVVNDGAFAIAAPAADGSCLIKITNDSSAGAITFSGFTVGASIGDALTTNDGDIFTLQIWRIDGTAGYSVTAHQ